MSLIKKILNSTTPNTGKQIKPKTETPNQCHNYHKINTLNHLFTKIRSEPLPKGKTCKLSLPIGITSDISFINS